MPAAVNAAHLVEMPLKMPIPQELPENLLLHARHRRRIKSADGAEYPSIVFPTEDPNMTVRVDALNRQAHNSLSVKMEIVPIPLAMAQDMAGAVKKFF